MKDRIRYAASRGFAIDEDELRALFAVITSDGRKTYRTKNGIPSTDVIRRWRALNRDITRRKSESKPVSKLYAERRSHVSTLKTPFEMISAQHPGIFEDANRLWNLDKTEVSAENAMVKKVYSSTSSDHGGFLETNGTGSAKHVTAVVAVSASGKTALPFLIVEGKNVMASWFKPLRYEELQGVSKKMNGKQIIAQLATH